MNRDLTSDRRKEPQTSGPKVQGTRFRVTRRRALVLILIALVLFAWWVDVPVQWCRLAARRALRDNLPQTAVTWIHRSRSFRDSSSETTLLEARALARAGLTTHSLRSLRAATDQGADENNLLACKDLVLARRGDLLAAERLTTLRAGLLPAREAYEAIVRCALFHARWDWARSVLDGWGNDFPRDAAVPYLRGRIFELLEESQPAIGQYDAATELQSSLAKAAFRKGAILRELRQFDTAETAFLRCRKSPFLSIAMIEVADCRWQRGATEAAWEALEPYVEIPPQQLMELYLQVEEFVDEDRAALIAARIRDSQNNPDAAIPLLERVLDYNHRNVEAHNLLASALRKLGSVDEAKQQIAVVEELLKKRRKTTELRRLLSENPGDLEMRCDLADLYLQAESLLHAQLELATVLEQSPGHRRAHRLLAAVYREKARFVSEFAHLAEYHERLGQ